MRLVLHPEAEREIGDAAAWYEARGRGLGFDFMRAVDAAIAAALRAPMQSPVIAPGIRRSVLRRFPYVLVFRADDEALLVVACTHGRRDSGIWRSRA